jgi:hypothetical protein|uniref:Uncharacterized protein n=1 Tax=viral metagenome TaxID=1070528 RepID=A0A6C0LYG7_9ZZZZ
MDERLLGFLKNLTQSVENDELDQQQLQRVSEFFMSYQLYEHVENEDFNETDLIKFITLGWYIYNVMLKNEELD